MNDYYTYAYLREDNTPYYIGKGRGNRIHSKSNRVFNPPPKDRRIFLKQNLTEEDAFRHEVYMIAILGRKDLNTGILHNKSEGGVGGNAMKGKFHSDKTKEKMRNAQLGRKHTTQAKKNMSEGHKGIKYPNRKSSPRSEEHKNNLSKSIKLWWEKRKEIQSNGN